VQFVAPLKRREATLPLWINEHGGTLLRHAVLTTVTSRHEE
jgi:hypothetical protein